MKHWLYKVKKSTEIPGWPSSGQHDCYRDLVINLPKNPKFLEIGCGWGRSSWAWLDVLPSDTSYYILDNFCLQSNDLVNVLPLCENPKGTKRMIKQGISQREIFDKIVKQHSNYNLIKKIWHMSGDDWKKHIDYTQEWDLVYLDDDHTFKAVKNWLKRFKNVPIVCGDDYHPGHRGVVRAVNDYVEKYNKKFILCKGNFWIIKNS